MRKGSVLEVIAEELEEDYLSLCRFTKQQTDFHLRMTAIWFTNK